MSEESLETPHVAHASGRLERMVTLFIATLSTRVARPIKCLRWVFAAARGPAT